MVLGHCHVELGPPQRPVSRGLGSEMVPPQELKSRRETGDMHKVTEKLAGRAGTSMPMLCKQEQLVSFQLLLDHIGAI